MVLGGFDFGSCVIADIAVDNAAEIEETQEKVCHLESETVKKDAWYQVLTFPGCDIGIEGPFVIKLEPLGSCGLTTLLSQTTFTDVGGLGF